MHAGPLRQAIAVVGLLALTPTMIFLALGRISPGDAALRALVTFACTLALGRLLTLSLQFYLRSAEGAEVSDEVDAGRRAGDHVA